MAQPQPTSADLHKDVNERNWNKVEHTVEVCPEILSEKYYGASSLCKTIEGGSLDFCLRILVLYASVAAINVVNSYRSVWATVLHFLAFHGRILELEVALGISSTRVNWQREKDGHSPLHELFINDDLTFPIHMAIAQLLIANGADVSLRDKDGKTPIHWYIENKCRRYDAATKQQDMAQILEILHGAEN